jgi:hypothetical protein
VPTAPTAVSATGSDASASVSWQPPTSDGGSPVTGYYVNRYAAADGAFQAQFQVAASARSHTSTGLTNGLRYYFQVYAINSAGNSAAARSNTVNVAGPPGQPTGVTATRGGSQTANVTWTAPASNGGAAIDFYYVNRYRGGAYDGNATTTTTSISMGGLTNGQEYYFEVYAHNTAGLYSSPPPWAGPLLVAGPPDPPSGVVASNPADRQITVSWTPPPADRTGGMPIDYYYIYTYNANTRAIVKGDTSSGTSRVIDGLTNGQPYYFVVYSHTQHDYNAYGFSGPSADSNTLAPELRGPGTPVISSATHPAGTWQASRTAAFTWVTTAGQYPVAGYSVGFDTNPIGAAPAAQTTVLPSHNQPGIPDGTHHLHVKAFDTNGNSGGTGHRTVNVDGTPPAAPTITFNPEILDGPEPAWRPTNNALIGWSATDTAPIDGYSWTVDQNPATVPDTTSEGTASSTQPALADGTWQVHVRARNASGLWGDTAHRTLRIDTTRPTAATAVSPSHNTTDAVRTRTATFDWTAAPGTDATSGIAGYSWSVTANSGDLPDGTVDTSATKISTTLADGTHYFHVAAVDRAGNVSFTHTYGPIRVDQNAPPVADTDRDRFIQLWKPRVVSDTYGRDYLATPGYSPAVTAEGYHGLAEEQKRYLIDALYPVLRVDAPPGEDDAAMEDAIKAVLYDFVFAKDKLEAGPDLSRLINDPIGTVSETPSAATPLFDAAVSARAPLDHAPELPSPELPSTTDDTVGTAFESVPDLDLVPAAGELSTETAQGLAGLNVDDAGQDAAAELAALAADALPLPTAIFPPAIKLPVDVDYTVCWRSNWEGAPREGCQKALALGAPTSIDVTGDGTQDLTATFGPSVDVAQPAPAPALTFEYRLTRHALPLPADTDGKPISAHVWIVYDLAAFDRTVQIGFDGLTQGDRLSEATTALYTFSDPVRLAQKDLLSAYRVNHTGPGARWALTAGTKKLTDGDDYVEASVQTVPPVNAAGRLDIVNDDEVDPLKPRNRSFAVTAQTTGATRVDAAWRTGVVSQDRASRNRLILENLAAGDSAATVTDTATSREGASDPERRRSIVTSGEADIAHVVLNAASEDAAEDTSITADLRNVPATASYSVTEFDGRTQHKFDTPGKRMASAAVAFTKSTDGVLDLAATARLNDLADDMDLRYGPSEVDGDDRMLFNYTASAVVASATLRGYRRQPATVVSLDATTIPTLITAHGSASSRGLAAEADAPIGTLSLTLSRNGAAVYRPGPQHATLRSSGTELGVSLRVDGLKSLAGSFAGGVAEARTDVRPAGQRLLVHARTDDLVGLVDISRLPTTTDVRADVAATDAHLTTSSRIPNAVVYASRSGGPHLDLVLDDVPTDVDIDADLAESGKTVSYRADGTLGDVRRFLFTSDGTIGDAQGTTVQGRLLSLPRSVDLVGDVAAGQVRASTVGTGSAGLVDVTLSVNGGRVQRPAGEHLTARASGDALGGSVRIAGLTDVDVDVDTAERRGSALVAVTPGGQPFRLDLATADRRLQGSLTNLPSRITIDGDLPAKTLTYNTAERVERVDGYYSASDGPTIRARVDDLPARADLSVITTGSTTVAKIAANSSIASAYVFYSDRQVALNAKPSDDYAEATVAGLFESATVTFDAAARHVAYRASDPVQSAAGAATGLVLDDFKADFAATDVPASFDGDFADGRYGFTANGGRIGSLRARASNDGPLQAATGRHLRGHADLSEGRFNLTASLPNIAAASYGKDSKGLRVDAAVDLAGESLDVDVAIDDIFPAAAGSGNEFRAAATGRLTALPTSLSVNADDAAIAYRTTGPLAGDLRAAVGWSQALAVTNWAAPRSGASVVDGSCGGSECPAVPQPLCSVEKNRCYGLKARYNYTGTVKDLTVNLDDAPAGQPLATVTGLTGQDGVLSLLADLRHLVGTPFRAVMTQRGIPAETDLSFGPFSVGAAGGAGGLPVELTTAHSKPLGRLTADITLPGKTLDVGEYRFDQIGAQATASTVPAGMTIRAGVGAISRATIDVTAPVDLLQVGANARVQRQNGTGYDVISQQAFGNLRFEDVPAAITTPQGRKVVDVTVQAPKRETVTTHEGLERRVKTIAVPAFEYSAPAGTADLGLSVDEALVAFDINEVFGAELSALAVDTRDMGTRLTASYDTKLRQLVINSPETRTTAMTVLSGPFTVFFDETFRNQYTLPTVARLAVDADVAGEITADAAQLTVTDIAGAEAVFTSHYLTVGTSGDFGTLSLQLPGLKGQTDGQLDAQLDRWPFWNWVPPYYRLRVPLDIDKKDLYAHVLDADSYGDLGPCLGGQVGYTTLASARLQLRPAPSAARNWTRNGFTVTGNGRKVVSYLDANGNGGVASAAAELLGVLLNPFGNTDLKVRTALGEGAC